MNTKKVLKSSTNFVVKNVIILRAEKVNIQDIYPHQNIKEYKMIQKKFKKVPNIFVIFAIKNINIIRLWKHKKNVIREKDE